MTPKYLADVDHGICWPESLIPSGLFFRRLKRIATVFCVLTRRRHLVNQAAATSICFCSWMAARFGFRFTLWNIVSSANRERLDFGNTGISLVNIKYRRGDRQEPWGTPAETGLYDETVFSVRTLNCLPFRKEAISFVRWIGVPCWCIL